MIKKIYLSIAIALLPTLTIFAQNIVSYSLGEYRTNVLNYSQELKQSQESVIAAKAGVKAVGSGMLPNVSFDGSANYMVNPMELSLGSGAPITMEPFNWGTTLTVSQNVFNGGAVRKQRDAARIGQEIAIYNEELTFEEIVYRADIMYWNVVTMNAYAVIMDQYLVIIQDTYNIVKDRYDEGLISMNDLLLIETRLREVEVAVANSKKQVKSTTIATNTLMGVEPFAPFNYKDSVLMVSYTLPKEIAADSVIALRSEYRMAEGQVRYNQQNVRVTKSDYLPKLNVGVTGQYGTKSFNIDKSLYPNAYAFASLNIPIFTGNSRKHRVAIDESNVRSSELQKDAVVDMIRNDVATTWSNLYEVSIQLGLSKKSLDIASKSLELNTFSYNEGLLSIIDLMQSQLSWVTSYNNYISMNYNYRIALVSYERAVCVYSPR